MECVRQSYWHTEYQWFKNYVVDTKAKKSFKDFAKNQYHKARRQHDKKIIEKQLDTMAEWI